MKNHMVEIGGEVRTNGLNIKNRKWDIGIQYPSFQRSINKQAYSDFDAHTVIKLSNMSIATSGDYRNYYDLNGQAFQYNPQAGELVIVEEEATGEEEISTVDVINEEE